MRQKLIKAGVQIIDHCPIEELLVSDGAVAGAIARYRRSGETLHIRSGAVVIATGGCAFRSGALGTNNLTGDGYLMAAEAGAVLSGMEFSAQFGISPAYSSVTKGVVYFWGSFSDEQGNELSAAGDRQSVVARELIRGQSMPFSTRRHPAFRRAFAGASQTFLFHSTVWGSTHSHNVFPITLRHEGTVRGTGGLKIDDRTTTTIPGLFAAGDAASRLGMSGASSGGGGPNSSWAMATGSWAGEDAAKFVQLLGTKWRDREVRSANAQLSERANQATGDVDAVLNDVKRQVLPLDGGFFRNHDRLVAISDRLATFWQDESWRLQRTTKVREVEALIATARWATHSALLRKEKPRLAATYGFSRNQSRHG
ncbi:FAD-binding protein [Ochrobactrum haematophilum]|uniref:FAD-binding protein n=1 Tax=Brucella haematophila TaxID=419474 RepID=A0ABX1DQN1_9HYPH|nr:FAD-binding protein [Brucella haematophila]